MVRVLEENRIGALVVSEDEGKTLVGIISERDVVRELNRVGGSVLDEPVRNLMTTDVYTCVPEDELETLAHTMTEKRVDRKSTRLNSSHVAISYAVFCLKKNEPHT